MGWIQQFKETFLTKDLNNGSFSAALMRLLPNIKSYTDFEGDTVQPKTYFIRAIPQMIFCIIIGAFIYNGFYRDTAAKVVDFGSEMVSRVLLEVDPIAVFDQFTGTAGRPVFASDNSEVPEEQLVNKIATGAYTAVIGEYNDITSAEAKRNLADALESRARDWVQGDLKDYTNKEEWRPVMQFSITNGAVDIDKINGKHNDNYTVMQYALQFPISDLGISSNKNVGLPMYMRIRVNFEKQVVATGNHKVTDIALHVSASKATSGLLVPSGSALYPRSTAGAIKATAVDSSGASVKDGFNVTVSDASSGSNKGRTIKITSAGSSNLKAGYTLTLATPISLIDSEHNLTHTITTIVIDASGDAYMSSKSESNNKFGFTYKELGVSKSSTATASASPDVE